MSRISNIIHPDDVQTYNRITVSDLRKDTILERDSMAIKRCLKSIRSGYTTIIIVLSFILAVFLYSVLHIEFSYEELIESGYGIFVIACLIVLGIIISCIIKLFTIDENKILYAQYGTVVNQYKLHSHDTSSDYYANVAFPSSNVYLHDVKCDFKQARIMKKGDKMLVISLDGKKAYGILLTEH